MRARMAVIAAIVVLASALVVNGCLGLGPFASEPGVGGEAAVDSNGDETPPVTHPTDATDSTQVRSGPAGVEGLTVDDQPRTFGYVRAEWPSWRDIDGDGCDARSQALILASDPPAETVGCDVIAGTWTSAYDGLVITSPSDAEIDHVVPLENAYRSGGWQWSTDRRASFANDQAELWVVSGEANGSKGSSAPDEWRPDREASWCRYASRWVEIKYRWGLTVTSSERDALGDMLATCPGSAPPTNPTTSAPETVIPMVTTPGVIGGVYYSNCDEARAAGVAPIRRDQAGYRKELDRNDDGVACE